MTYDQSYIARFQQEARAAAGLEHSHIVPIYEIGSADGFYYIAMKYIEGGTLKEIIDRDAPMPLKRVIDLLERRVYVGERFSPLFAMDGRSILLACDTD